MPPADFNPPAGGPPEGFDPLLRAIHSRRAALPLLLFVTGHRPLAFIAGQMLYAAAPLAAILGAPQAARWGDWLSAPDAAARLEAALATPPPSTDNAPHTDPRE